MKLEDYETVWGTPIDTLKEYSKKYRFWSSIIYLADVIVILAVTAYMFYAGVSYNAYGFVVVLVAIFVHFISLNCLNLDRWMAFKFYRRNKDKAITKHKLDLNEDTLYSVLYCAGCKRLKQGRTLAEYIELMRSSCCEDSKFAKKVIPYLMKYEASSGSLGMCCVTRGSYCSFIDFEESEVYDNGSSAGSDEDVTE